MAESQRTISRLARKARRLAAGICWRCGKVPCRDGKQLCGPCAAYQTAATLACRARQRAKAGWSPRPRKPARTPAETAAAHKAAYQARKAAGLCVNCRGGTPAVPGKSQCAECLRWQAGKRDELRAKVALTGGCTVCGGGRDRPGRKLCSSCNDYRTAERAARVAAGLCPCGRTRSDRGALKCSACNVADRRWKEYNRDKVLAAWHRDRFRRQQRLLMNGGNFTAAEWRALKKAQGHRCLACGRKEPEIRLTVDHVKAVSKGGSNGIENVQGLCGRCNLRKYVREIDYRTAE
jgi:5-methylcytosine-specific restriction endonuclease McrA